MSRADGASQRKATGGPVPGPCRRSHEQRGAWNCVSCRRSLRNQDFEPRARAAEGIVSVAAVGATHSNTLSPGRSEVKFYATRCRIGRTERRVLTASLNRPPATYGPEACSIVDGLRPRQWVRFARPCRRLFRRQRPGSSRLRWRGWPLRGLRIGEASKSGNVDALPAASFARFPTALVGTRPGWTSHDAMRAHLDDHAAGTLQGAVPEHTCRLRPFSVQTVQALLLGPTPPALIIGLLWARNCCPGPT